MVGPFTSYWKMPCLSKKSLSKTGRFFLRAEAQCECPGPVKFNQTRRDTFDPVPADGSKRVSAEEGHHFGLVKL
ncbi:hypothetical protein VTN96DRAFT_1568 [Rasamsonia emersonii]